IPGRASRAQVDAASRTARDVGPLLGGWDASVDQTPLRIVLLPYRRTRGQRPARRAAGFARIRRGGVGLIDGAEARASRGRMRKLAVQLETRAAAVAAVGHDLGYVYPRVERVELRQARGVGFGGHIHPDHENRC